MTDLLHAELLKLRTLRLTWVLSAMGLALAATTGVVGARLADGAVTAREVVLAPAQPVWFVVIVLAVLATAGEFQHHTVRTTLLAAPQRGRVLAAKAAVSAAFGAGLVATGCITALAAATAARAVARGALPSWSAGAVGALVAASAVGAVWAVVACGLGALTRSTAAALVGLLLWRFVGEGLLPIVTRSPGIGRWTPSGAADAVLGRGDGVVQGSGILLAWSAAVVLAAAVLFLRRDPA
jgi:ABC-type transport system involved in multi-copper enzyme maturation permease subunit